MGRLAMSEKFENKHMAVLQRWQIITGAALALNLGACEAGLDGPSQAGDADLAAEADDLLEQEISDEELENSNSGDAETISGFGVCGRKGSNLQDLIVKNAAFPDGAKQRTGPSESCLSRGRLGPRDTARYYCWTYGDDGRPWTFLRNMRTGLRGWTPSNELKRHGSDRFCGF
jgi:hypothetical protein